MFHSVIYTLEQNLENTDSFIELVASDAPAKQVWYAETYSFDTQL